MPECGVDLMSHKDILSFEEIVEVIRFGAQNGISKVRLTGGEPLVRKGIVDLVKMIAEIPGIEDLSMTSNGALLDQFAQPLADAGLKRVNISLDTVEEKTYKKVTRVGELSNVLKGIKAAQSVGLEPIKINCVIKKSPIEQNAQEVAEFCDMNDLQVRFIKEMDLETGYFDRVIGGDGGHCASCNRLRLTADGKLKPCLFDDLEFNVRELGVEAAYSKAIGLKPKAGSENTVNKFSNIGG